MYILYYTGRRACLPSVVSSCGVWAFRLCTVFCGRVQCIGNNIKRHGEGRSNELQLLECHLMIQINTVITAKIARTENARRYQHTRSVNENLPFSPNNAAITRLQRHPRREGRDMYVRPPCTPVHRAPAPSCPMQSRSAHSLHAGTPGTCATVPDAAAACRFLHAAHARPSCMP
jgi:hypothetical protein